MRSTLMLALLALMLAGPSHATVAPPSTPGVPNSLALAPGAISMHAAAQPRAPRTTRQGANAESVQPAERASEPEGVFGFARLALGLVVALIAGGVVLVWATLSRRRQGGDRLDR